LPPAYIARAGFDPIRDDGEANAAKLRAGGISVAGTRQADRPDGFLNFVGLAGRFAEAASEAAGDTAPRTGRRFRIDGPRENR